MSKVVSIAEKQIIDSVTAALKTNMANGTFIEADIPAFKTEIPADKNNGDYSANAAFMLSKALRMPPRKIAEEIQNKIDLSNTYFEKCEIAGPGFINISFKKETLIDNANQIKNNNETLFVRRKSSQNEKYTKLSHRKCGNFFAYMI